MGRLVRCCPVTVTVKIFYWMITTLEPRFWMCEPLVNAGVRHCVCRAVLWFLESGSVTVRFESVLTNTCLPGTLSLMLFTRAHLQLDTTARHTRLDTERFDFRSSREEKATALYSYARSVTSYVAHRRGQGSLNRCASIKSTDFGCVHSYKS
jgi:hypothetical protein